MRKTDPDMSRRLVEELYRISKTNTELCEKVGCSRTAVQKWINNGFIPSAYYFKKFHYAGCDIIYILTGERHARS